MVTIKHREQFDYGNDIELLILEPQVGIFTIAKHHTVADKWDYYSENFSRLIDAHKVYDKIMDTAPKSNKEEERQPTANSESNPC